jgi:hypothetical protein
MVTPAEGRLAGLAGYLAGEGYRLLGHQGTGQQPHPYQRQAGKPQPIPQMIER